LLRRSSPEDVKTDLKPLVDLCVYFVVFIAEFPRCDSLLQCFSFGGSAIFVGTADEKGRTSSCFVIPEIGQRESMKE